MRKFISFVEAKKPKKSQSKSVPMAQTTTSSPTRGSNQDYSGVSPSHDTADYTVSD